jgi:rod shape-determining protein MreD
MNKPLLLVAVILALAVDGGLIHAITFASLTPSLAMILVVFLALHAPRESVPWIGWAVGLLVDLATPYAHGGTWGQGPIIGPNALGWCFGAYAVMLVRAMLYRRQIHTVAVMVLGFSVAAALVQVFVLTIHGFYEPVPIFWAERGPLAELLRRLGCGLYSAVLALALGPVLQLTLPAWRFRSPMPRAVTRRA